jgi:hypothetical protein
MGAVLHAVILGPLISMALFFIDSALFGVIRLEVIDPKA